MSVSAWVVARPGRWPGLRPVGRRCLQQHRDVAGLGAGQLHQLVYVALVGQPGFRVLAVVGVGIEGDFGKRLDHLGVLLGEVFAHNPGIESRCAFLGQFARGDQHLAIFLGHAQGWVPDVGGVDVTTFPGGNDGRRRRLRIWTLEGRCSSFSGRPAGCSGRWKRTARRPSCRSGLVAS